ncbi:endo-1,4-beta xylanase [Cristinia sonorae]|uniref:Beta-xylanase n=1 Tax=Cristinia sonorae TaxID=1940300 RepID=A0A8K0UQ70_9AGAR|nr:endo-1,4-beta xylanase [Cristinia sonorae]
MFFASFIPLLALVQYVVSAALSSRAGQELHTLAKAKGKVYFGSATDNPELTDAPYVAILSDNNMFGQTTATNSMKWDATEPNRGQFTFTNGDVIANLAKKNGQLLRGHNCVWHQQLPAWVTNGHFSKTDLLSIVQNHCGTLVGHYKGQVYAWDVVNEIFNDDGTIRQDVFSQTTGMDFIATAFRAARAADPNAKLYANDFNIEGPGAKSTAYQNLIRSLKSQGVPIDGIGMQAHFIVGELPPNIQQNMEAFAALGVDIAITELDVRMTLPSTPALLAQQQRDYETVIKACVNVPRCVGVTIWDFTDKFSWVPGTFAGQGAACPWDQNLVQKPAFQGIVAGFS